MTTELKYYAVQLRETDGPKPIDYDLLVMAVDPVAADEWIEAHAAREGGAVEVVSKAKPVGNIDKWVRSHKSVDPVVVRADRRAAAAAKAAEAKP